MKLLYFFIQSFLFTILIWPNENIFSEVNWSFEREKKGIELYIATDYDKGINYYRSSTVIKDIDIDRLSEILCDFNQYKDIFPRTIEFNPIEKVSEEKFVIHAILNFSPYKNREYLVFLTLNRCIKENRKKYEVFWSPVEDISAYSIKEKFNNNYEYITTVYGMWSIEDIGNNEIKITFYSFNDWKINAPEKMKIEFEKSAAINNIKNLLNYFKKKK